MNAYEDADYDFWLECLWEKSQENEENDEE